MIETQVNKQIPNAISETDLSLSDETFLQGLTSSRICWILTLSSTKLIRIMLNKPGARSRIFFVLASLTLTVLMLILTLNYVHIQINNLNVVNMYFSIRRNETTNEKLKVQTKVKICAFGNAEECKAGEKVHVNPKTKSNTLPSVVERLSATHLETKEFRSNHLHSVNRTAMALRDSSVRKSDLHNQNKSDNNSSISSKSRLDDTPIYLINTSTEYVNPTGYDKPDTIQGETQFALSTVNANISVANGILSETACVKRLPGCIITGVQKCGTKALAEFLKSHPNVSLDSRQTYFFSQHYDKGLDWYRNQMACSKNHQLVLERTPQYFYYKEVPKRIYEMNKQIKLIFIVCDPIIRAISNFAMAKDRDRDDVHDNFEDCILGKDRLINSSCKYVRKSNYQKFMIYWLNVFPLTQIHIVNGTMLKDDPAAVLKDVEKFLCIPPYIKEDHFVENIKTGFKCLRKEKSEKMDCLSRKKGRRHPFVKKSVVSLLKEYFRPRNIKFYNMIGQKFNW